MSLRRRFILYLWLLHGGVGVAVGLLIWQWISPGLTRGFALLAVELLVPVSLWLGHRLVDRLLTPMELAVTGAELIAERDFSSTYRPTGQPDTDRLIEVYNRMILELRQERLRQQEQEDFLQRLVIASPAGIVLTDLDDRITQINPRAEKLLGIGDPPPESVAALPQPWARSLGSLTARGSTVVSLSDGRRVRSRVGEFRDRGFPRRFFLLEELTEELRQSEKAAYDKLLRMVSHEVNNSVAAVTSLLASLEFLARGLDGEEKDDAQRALEISSDRLQRMQSFIESLTQVIRLPEPHPKPMDLDVVLDDLLRLMRPTLEKKSIEVDRRNADRLPALKADRLQLEQALINVMKNAIEAMDDSPKKILSLRTSMERGIPRLEITDSGTGIDSDTAEHLFTPFFSTKKDGCGIGLTLAREILSAHGWGFALEPNQDSGATFSIFFSTAPDGLKSTRDAEDST